MDLESASQRLLHSLPSDILRMIFEAATSDDSKAAFELMTLSHGAYAWLRPIAYRTVVLKSEADVHRFKSGIQRYLRRTQTETVHHVKHLVIMMSTAQRRAEKASLVGIDAIASDTTLNKRIAWLAKTCVGLRSAFCCTRITQQDKPRPVWNASQACLALTRHDLKWLATSHLTHLFWHSLETPWKMYWTHSTSSRIHFPPTLQYLVLDAGSLFHLREEVDRQTILELTNRDEFKALVVIGPIAMSLPGLITHYGGLLRWLCSVPAEKLQSLDVERTSTASGDGSTGSWWLATWLAHIQGDDICAQATPVQFK
ncbi:hypothetical protein EXIGLDRAFT_725303 [Exidia glandulosa HHB12029]|uniref:F-box domain-containing protein n=1 Tax=Exidia glandulosa HHB12029 TaxID=1314781 RepID=A0A166BA66_EXIGL|nr:hypothetical protein EXIGLDRAFT_725303 [Exidia glandulosa HHB12029]